MWLSLVVENCPLVLLTFKKIVLLSDIDISVVEVTLDKT